MAGYSGATCSQEASGIHCATSALRLRCGERYVSQTLVRGSSAESIEASFTLPRPTSANFTVSFWYKSVSTSNSGEANVLLLDVNRASYLTFGFTNSVVELSTVIRSTLQEQGFVRPTPDVTISPSTTAYWRMITLTVIQPSAGPAQLSMAYDTAVVLNAHTNMLSNMGCTAANPCMLHRWMLTRTSIRYLVGQVRVYQDMPRMLTGVQLNRLFSTNDWNVELIDEPTQVPIPIVYAATMNEEVALENGSAALVVDGVTGTVSGTWPQEFGTCVQCDAICSTSNGLCPPGAQCSFSDGTRVCSLLSFD